MYIYLSTYLYIYLYLFFYLFIYLYMFLYLYINLFLFLPVYVFLLVIVLCLPLNALEPGCLVLAAHEQAAPPGSVDVQPDTVALTDVWGGQVS